MVGCILREQSRGYSKARRKPAITQAVVPPCHEIKIGKSEIGKNKNKACAATFLSGWHVGPAGRAI